MHNILINVNGTFVTPVDVRVFHGGEVNVSIPDRKYPRSPSTVCINARMTSAVDVLAVVQTADAVRRKFPTVERILLDMPYAPYARQDRVCNEGESLTSKVFADLINSCNFSCVEIVDPHSDVLPALIDRCHVIGMDQVIASTDLAEVIIRGDLTLVSPDAGAVKKVEKLAKRMGSNQIVYGSKTRDLKTGSLSGFGYQCDFSIKDKDLLIVDDICDGGGTFIGLAERLKNEGGARSVSLYVTHGIFSRGVDNLLRNGIKTIWTTNSLQQVQRDELVILEL